jgi:NitT/TauT family transport system permease protein
VITHDQKVGEKADRAAKPAETAPAGPPVLLLALRAIWLPVVAGVVGLALWEGLVRSGLVSDLILPTPTSIAIAVRDIIQVDGFSTHVATTAYEVVLGFLLAVFAGGVFGAAFGLFAPVKRAVYPYVVVIQSLPKVAFAPILIVALGFGYSSKIGMAMLVGFFPVFINTMSGLSQVPAEYTALMQSIEAGWGQWLRKVAIPYALPTMFAGIKTSLTFAVIGAIIGEFQGARAGLGYLIEAYSSQIAIPEAFAAILMVGLLSIVLFAIVEFLERRLVFWGDTNRR